jgi:hypothetical protein
MHKNYHLLSRATPSLLSIPLFIGNRASPGLFSPEPGETPAAGKEFGRTASKNGSGGADLSTVLPGYDYAQSFSAWIILIEAHNY